MLSFLIKDVAKELRSLDNALLANETDVEHNSVSQNVYCDTKQPEVLPGGELQMEPVGKPTLRTTTPVDNQEPLTTEPEKAQPSPTLSTPTQVQSPELVTGKSEDEPAGAEPKKKSWTEDVRRHTVQLKDMLRNTRAPTSEIVQQKIAALRRSIADALAK